MGILVYEKAEEYHHYQSYDNEENKGSKVLAGDGHEKEAMGREMATPK